MKYLITTVETYRVSSEDEAISMIQEAKNSNQYTLVKYNSQYKERKQKGEVVDYWWKVSLTKEFTSEKEPITETRVNYELGTESAF